MMGPAGAFVMSFFATLFASFGLAPILGWRDPVMAVALVPTALIYAVAAKRARAHIGAIEDPRIGRIILWSSVAEGVGILLMVNILANIGLGHHLLAGVAVVVGLHFVPMAVLIPFPRFYALTAALLAIAGVAFALPVAQATPIAGIGAALVLWAASVMALRPR